MGDEKETWKVKTLDEILQEKKRRRELEEKSDPKRPKNTDDRESKRDTPEEGELRDHRMEITIRNSPYTREDSTEDRCVCVCVCVDRLEQLERQRERERKLREQQQREQRELKERERRAEERRKERDARRDGVSTHTHTAPPDTPVLATESIQPRHTKLLREGKMEEKNPLSDLQDISDSERKTATPESSMGSGSEDEEGEENDEEESSSQSEGEEEGESGSDSVGSEHSEDSHTHSLTHTHTHTLSHTHTHSFPESRFDHDSEVSAEEEEEEEGAEEAGDVTPQSPSHSATPEDNYIPESPPISPVELKKELPKYLPALQGCRSVEEFQCLNRIEEGTYGVVYRAKDKKTDEIVALKRLKMEKEKEGFPITSLREINTILKAQHPNIVTVREIVVGSNMDKIYIVMNYVEHDLKSLMETMKQPFLPGEVKTLMIQLLRGVRHLHDNWILHRDLKTSNLLLSHKGILKIGDFGLAREYGSPLKPYTPVVVTLWYRSPDLLLGAKEYSTAVDMWSVGCIFGELLTQKPLFPGKSEIDQINKVFKDLGSPSEKIWPGYSELPAVKKMTFTEYPYNNLRKRFGALLSDQGFDLMNKFLTYCPAKRISADEALKHEYFRESPLPIEPSMFPTWPAKSEQQRVKRGTSPRPPEGGQDFSQLGDDDLKDTGFHLTTANQGASKAGPGFSLKF
uniref:cyclin-dependent kinase n=1 Tax=Cyprinus carpio carpio TaxID=630221 RepID=A0A9J7XI87_CYPCA